LVPARSPLFVVPIKWVAGNGWPSARFSALLRTSITRLTGCASRLEAGTTASLTQFRLPSDLADCNFCRVVSEASQSAWAGLIVHILRRGLSSMQPPVLAKALAASNGSSESG